MENAMIKSSIKIAAFLYFLFQENLTRAKAEAELSGIFFSTEEWEESVSERVSLKLKLKEYHLEILGA